MTLFFQSRDVIPTSPSPNTRRLATMRTHDVRLILTLLLFVIASFVIYSNNINNVTPDNWTRGINSHERGRQGGDDETRTSRELAVDRLTNVHNYRPEPESRSPTWLPFRDRDVSTAAVDRYGRFLTSHRRNVNVVQSSATPAPSRRQMKFSREQTRRRHDTKSRGIIGRPSRHSGDGKNMASVTPVSPVEDSGGQTLRSEKAND